MDKIVIEGIPPWDGSYDFDASLTNGELRTIKKVTGIRAGELVEALAAGDTDVLVALAVIVLSRHDKHVDPDDFWNAEAGAITYVTEDEVDPPDESSPSENASE